MTETGHLYVEFEHSESTNPADHMRRTLEQLGFENVIVKTEGEFTLHPDWNEGEPCPNCGYESFHVVMKGFGKHAAQGDHLMDMSGDLHLGDYLQVACEECNLQVLANPVGAVLHEELKDGR